MPVDNNNTYAKRAERYAEKCAYDKSANVPKPVSDAYVRWLHYKKFYNYRREHLDLVCGLLENVVLTTDGKKRLQLQDWQCALLSWPLVFVHDNGDRVINELHFLAPRGTGISTIIAGLMLAELANPFRNNQSEARDSLPCAIIAAGPYLDLANISFRQALWILEDNPKFQSDYEIKSNQKYIKSKKTGAFIEQRTVRSKTFAHPPGTFIFADAVGIMKSQDPLPSVRKQMKARNKNYLLVTAGTPGRAKPSALNPIRRETMIWLRDQTKLGNRTGLLYQAEEGDSYKDPMVWEKVHPGLDEEHAAAIFERTLQHFQQNEAYFERQLLAKMESETNLPAKKEITWMEQVSTLDRVADAVSEDIKHLRYPNGERLSHGNR